MFKVGHIYRVNHCGTKCVIKVMKLLYNSERLREVKIIKLFNQSNIYHEGLVTNWYEDWCKDITEIKNHEELIAVML